MPNDQPDQNRMILQGSCLARLANALRMKVFEKEPIVISAIFIDRKLVAHEYLMYQPDLGDNKVLYHEKTFDLSNPKRAFEFIFRLYNLISRAINDNGKLDDDLLTDLMNLKAKYPYAQYPALTTDHLSNNKKKNPSASNDDASGSRKRPRTEEGNTQKRGDILEGRSVQESLEHAGYMITHQEDDRVAAQLTSRMRTARSRDGAPVVLKLLDDDTDELKILQYLSSFKLPSNHAIELHGLVDLTIGRVIALPCRTPLDVYFHSWYPVRSTVSLQTQLLEGVAFLHEHKIAHLDLKPGNVVIDSKSDRYCPRLSIIDFGLSVLVEDEETMIEGYRGTRTWTAPEVGTSDDPDTKYNPIFADRWACGRMINYLEDHDLEGDNSCGVLRKLCEALLADNPRSRPSVSEVLEKYGLYERDRVVKRRAGEDEMDVIRKRIRVNCAEDIVNVNGPTLRIEMDDGINGNWIACS
ncbi:kinase-like domain-containing protein [Multifurca ochricompacta]|uniref:Kinase-like domain-containing protein n=1 Tax=Multifurca ochricompacta TaxID=376703 RepID=A0AAD4LZK3_9AGAM|nr:kinase-like domain-containing protein [Multifurca ochricompacta]